MSRLRPNWLNGLKVNVHGVTDDELVAGKLLVFRNGQLLSVDNDYTYDGTNVNFLIDIAPRDVILLVDPSIGGVRRLQGGTNVVIEEPEPSPQPDLESELTLGPDEVQPIEEEPDEEPLDDGIKEADEE